MFDIKVCYLKFSVMQLENMLNERIGFINVLWQKALCMVMKTELELQDLSSECGFDWCCANIRKAFNFFSAVLIYEICD